MSDNKETKQAPAVEAGARDDVVAALRELVRLKDLKGEAETHPHPERSEGWKEHKRLAPQAWANARAALARASEAATPADDDTRERIARALHYPACWDTAAYPTLESAAWEAIACAKLGCSTCDSASEAAAAEPVDYDRVVQVCEAHGICLPIDCVEMVVEIIRLAAPQPALADEVLMQAIADTAARGHIWASRAISNFRAALGPAKK